jgi:hypothetical protein
MLKSMRFGPTTISVEIGTGVRAKFVCCGGQPGSEAPHAADTRVNNRIAATASVRDRKGSGDIGITISRIGHRPVIRRFAAAGNRSRGEAILVWCTR